MFFIETRRVRGTPQRSGRYGQNQKVVFANVECEHNDPIGILEVSNFEQYECLQRNRWFWRVFSSPVLKISGWQC